MYCLPLQIPKFVHMILFASIFYTFHITNLEIPKELEDIQQSNLQIKSSTHKLLRRVQTKLFLS